MEAIHTGTGPKAPSNRIVRGLLLTLTCLGFLLRAYRLGYPELRGDEAFGLLFSTQSLGHILQQTLQFLEPHPPLDYALLHFWTALAGDSEYAIRFTSLVFGVLAIPLTYHLGRLLDSEEAGLWAAVFVAVNPFQIWHAQEARMYAISTTLGLAASVALLHAIRGGRHRAWVAFVLLSVANAYTHYYALFLILAQGLYWLALWPRYHRQWRTWLGAQLAILLLYLPWLIVGWRVLTAYHGNGDSPTFFDMIRRCLVAFSLGQTVSPQVTAYLLLFFALASLLGLAYLLRRSLRNALFVTLYLGVPVLAVYLSSLGRPVFNERYLIAATPPFYILLALGVTSLARWLGRRGKVLTYILAALLIGASLYSLYGYFYRPEYTRSRGWRELAARLTQVTRPEDIIIQNYPDPTMWYYYHGETPHTVVPAERPLDEKATVAALGELGQAHDRVWFVPYKSADWDSTGFVTTWLDRHWERVSEDAAGTFALRLYRPPHISLSEAFPSGVRWGEQVALRAYQLEPNENGQTSLTAGQPLYLTLFWEPLDKMSVDYTVFVHLLSPDGQMVAQRDSQPLRGTFPTSAWQPDTPIVDKYVIIVPEGVAAGEYSLALGLYDARTGDRLSVTQSGTGARGDRYILPHKLTVLK